MHQLQGKDDGGIGCIAVTDNLELHMILQAINHKTYL